MTQQFTDTWEERQALDSQTCVPVSCLLHRGTPGSRNKPGLLPSLAFPVESRLKTPCPGPAAAISQTGEFSEQ